MNGSKKCENLTGALPESWSPMPLGSVGAWAGGGTPTTSEPRFWNGNVPWVSPKDMKRPRISVTQDTITDEALENSAATLIPEDSVLIVTRSGILRHSLPVAINTRPVALNQDIKAITPHDGISSGYLHLALQCFEREILHQCCKGGTTVQSIEIPRLKSFSIPVPPLPEQHRIVAKIEELFSELDKGIENLKQAKAQLAVYGQALLKHAFEGKLTTEWRAKQGGSVESGHELLGRIRQSAPASNPKCLVRESSSSAAQPANEPKTPPPKEWALANVRQLGVVQLGRQRSPKNVSKDYPTKYIRAANITESGLDLADVKDMEFTPEELENYRLEKGDIILSEASGSASQVGKPAIWNNEIKNCCFQNTVIRHRPFLPCTGPFLLTLYKYFYGSGVFARVAAGVGINHLSANKFAAIPVPLPPLAEQAVICETVETQLSMLRNFECDIETNLAKAEALRQSILKKAFSGQLVRPDPIDEATSVSL